MVAKSMDFAMGSCNPFFATGFNPKSPRVRDFTVKCSSASFSADGASIGLVERPWKVADARLMLEDGSIWRAKSFGASGTQVGEVVFNTSLTGYQEILTDPSYAGQFVLMTNPHIGNTGVNFDDEESQQCFLAGLVIRSLSITTSNWRCTETLGDYLVKRNIMGIYDVDTRAITRRLRQDGSLIGVLSTEYSKTDEELLEMSRTWDIVGVDLISGVSCKAPYEWVDKTDTEWDFNSNGRERETYHVIAYDYGIKHNILRRLASYGCKITVVPSTWSASETLKLKPDGVLFSNGPGDPSAVPYAVESVKEIIGKVPIFWYLHGPSLGGNTYKMKFGHHGGNHLVRNLRSGRVEISAHNELYHLLHVGINFPGLTFLQQIISGLICAAVREVETALSCYNSIYTNVPGQPIWAVAENYRFEPTFVESRKLMPEIGDMMIIVAIICGKIGQVPVQKILRNGRTVTIFTVGTGGMYDQRILGAKDLPKPVQWHRIAVHNDALGAYAVQQLVKNSSVYVEGDIETRVYNDSINGTVKNIPEICVRRDGRIRLIKAGESASSISLDELREGLF